MKLIPIEDRIIVEPDPIETLTESGIHLPENMRRDSSGTRWGRVIAAGPGAYNDAGVRIDHGIAEGDHVAFGEYAGAAVDREFMGDEIFILRAEEVLLIERA